MFLHEIGINGLIFQDFGVLQIVNRKGYGFKMIYHPLTLNTNSSTLNTLSHYGISGAFVSKEISLKEQLEIRKNCDMPLFVLGHGVQYMMMSKRHLISNYEKAYMKQVVERLYSANLDSIHWTYSIH